jgi:hypothetical protein
MKIQGNFMGKWVSTSTALFRRAAEFPYSRNTSKKFVSKPA